MSVSYRTNLLPIAARPKPANPERKTLYMRLLDWLVECADANERMPSNNAICARFDLNNVNDAVRMLSRLCKENLISIYVRGSSRAALIVADGRVTKAPVDRRLFDAWLLDQKNVRVSAKPKRRSKKSS